MDELTVGHATDLVAKELINRIRHWLSMNEKERAVIEAARARQRYLETHQHRVCHGTENVLFAAVEALEREEP